MKKYILLPIFFTLIYLFPQNSYSQMRFNIGYIYGSDLYHRLTNPVVEGVEVGRSSGSVLANINMGLKMYLGGENFSVSAEGLGAYGLFGLDLTDYKGLGTLSVPLMAKLNFKGLSGLGDKFKFGYSIGGGLQYSKTELYGVKSKYKDLGVTRPFYDTYVVEGAMGFGQKAFTSELFLRGGLNPSTKARAFHIGINFVYSFRHKLDRGKLFEDLDINIEEEENKTFKM